MLAPVDGPTKRVHPPPPPPHWQHFGPQSGVRIAPPRPPKDDATKVFGVPHSCEYPGLPKPLEPDDVLCSLSADDLRPELLRLQGLLQSTSIGLIKCLEEAPGEYPNLMRRLEQVLKNFFSLFHVARSREARALVFHRLREQIDAKRAFVSDAEIRVPELERQLAAILSQEFVDNNATPPSLPPRREAYQQLPSLDGIRFDPIELPVQKSLHLGNDKPVPLKPPENALVVKGFPQASAANMQPAAAVPSEALPAVSAGHGAAVTANRAEQARLAPASLAVGQVASAATSRAPRKGPASALMSATTPESKVEAVGVPVKKRRTLKLRNSEAPPSSSTSAPVSAATADAAGTPGGNAGEEPPKRRVRMRLV